MSALNWRIIDIVIANNDGLNKWFKSRTLAKHLGISGALATDLIQDYQREQAKGIDSRTLHTITRSGRTSGAKWHVGNKAIDIRRLSDQLGSDLRCRINRATLPVLAQIGKQNPRSQVRAEIAAARIEYGVDELVRLLTEK